MVQPADGVRIGATRPASRRFPTLARFSGSALGVIIDARGRPLRLPDDPLTRQQRLWDWMVALGVESGPLPYTVADRLPAMPEPTLNHQWQHHLCGTSCPGSRLAASTSSRPECRDTAGA